MKIRMEAYGKLNLFLEVTGKASDGYHDLQTVMQSVSIADRLTLAETAGPIEVVCDHPDVPGGEENIAYRAAALLREREKVDRGVRIEIEKSIPAAAGLGGGSSDAAAVLAGLARLWKVDRSVDRLAALGGEIGSDVPFFFYGGTRLCEGRGEIVSPFPPVARSARFLVVTPERRLATSFVYQDLDRMSLTGRGPSSNLKKVRRSDDTRELLLHGMFNRLEEVVLPTYPDIREVRGRMKRLCPAGVFMSGSGPTHFGLLPEGRTDEDGILSRFGDCRFAAIAHPTFSGYRFLRDIEPDS